MTGDDNRIRDPIAHRSLRAVATIMDEHDLPKLDALERAGNCYILSLRYFAERPYPRPESIVIVALCHGFVRLGGDGPGAGRLAGHAWVELTWLEEVPEHLQDAWGAETISSVAVWDPTQDAYAPLPQYYLHNQIEPEFVTRWTDSAEVLSMLVHTENVGNWADESQLPEPAFFIDE
mgnify:CR=1 FL=1|tara:strand:+ start:680 stop:1210 length:531 start_codon:yes stop_codon:yes gene_type:complete